MSFAFCTRRVTSQAIRELGLVVFAAFINATFPASVYAAETLTLTLSAAQQAAVVRSRQLVAKDFATSASREMSVAARQLPDPIVRAGVDNLPVTGPDKFSLTNDFMTMRRLGVAQELTRSDKRSLRAEKFEREADKSIAEKTEAIATIQRETALAWIDRYYAEATAAVIAEQSVQATFEIQAAEGAYRAGRGTQADVYSARSALVSFVDRSSEAERRIRNAKVMLARWVGDRADLPLAGAPAFDTIRLDTGALETTLSHHPRIAVLSQQQAIAESDAKLAQANKKPDWTVELMYQQRGPAFSNMVSLGFSLPFQLDRKNRQDREVSSKLAIVEQARAERDDALRAHVAETSTLINEWKNDRERASRFIEELIPLAASRTRAALVAYGGGKSVLNDVLLARRNEIDVRLQALQLQLDAAKMWAQLNFLLPDQPNFDHPNTAPYRNLK